MIKKGAFCPFFVFLPNTCFVMNLIDTHTHLYLPEFEADRHDVVQVAIRAGVDKMLLPNIDLSTLTPMLKLAEAFPRHCYPMIGLHPTSVKEDYRQQLEEMFVHLNEGSYVGIGEVGIDLYWDKKFGKEQTEAFRQQIEWALNFKLPLVIHSRESLPLIFSVLEEFPQLPTGVFHSFTGTQDQAEHAIEKGFFLGVGGIVTFKNSSLKDTLLPLGPDHLVLETDAPFLAPAPKRGRRNESSYLVYIAQFLADLFSVKPETLADITTRNALKLFSCT